MQSLSLFLRVHEMFQFPAFPCAAYVFSCAYRGIARGGFPHSDIPGSRPVCGSPRLFAAYHVLRRLPAPRHPPCALRSLTNYFSNRLFARLLSLVSLQLSFLARYPLVVFPFALFLFTSPFHSLSSLFPMRLPKSIARSILRNCGQIVGGDDRTRTDDPQRAKQVLSQLSYIPIFTFSNKGNGSFGPVL